jgi:trk system potassium uptake protein
VHIVIMGCGRVGSALAQTLSEANHSVAVIDQSPESFTKLGPAFNGKTVTGVGFDRDHLRATGIAEAQAFAAVSSGDNSNILAARVARETFGVENVVARIYDPRRASVYERLGIPTVATVAWTTDQILRRLLPMGAQEEWSDGSGTISLAEVHVHPDWVGHRITDLQQAAAVRVAFLTRYGEGTLPGPDTVLQDGDLVHVMLRRSDRAAVETALAVGPGGKK